MVFFLVYWRRRGCGSEVCPTRQRRVVRRVFVGEYMRVKASAVEFQPRSCTLKTYPSLIRTLTSLRYPPAYAGPASASLREQKHDPVTTKRTRLDALSRDKRHATVTISANFFSWRLEATST